MECTSWEDGERQGVSDGRFGQELREQVEFAQENNSAHFSRDKWEKNSNEEHRNKEG